MVIACKIAINVGVFTILYWNNGGTYFSAVAIAVIIAAYGIAGAVAGLESYEVQIDDYGNAWRLFIGLVVIYLVTLFVLDLYFYVPSMVLIYWNYPA